jgi:hypothetical protein
MEKKKIKKCRRYKAKMLRKLNKTNSIEQRHEKIKIHGYERKMWRINCG